MKGDQSGCGIDCSSPHLLSRLTFGEIERKILRCPALILPLGGCEPYGSKGALGIASACSEAIAAALSRRNGMLLAPVLHYGCSTPYSAFGGAAGLKPRTLANALCEILRRLRRQGIGRVVIIDPLFDNGPALEEATARLKKWDRNLLIVTFALQRDARVRAFIGRRCTINEPGRSEFAMLSMASYIDPGLVRTGEAGERKDRPVSKPDLHKKWRRRGADPEQFRALFPDGSTGGEECSPDSAIGRELFEYISAALDETVASLIPPPRP